MAAGIPDDVRKLINDHIKSVEQLEVLLLLRASPERDWDADEVSRELQSTPTSTAERLQDLAGRGFLEVTASAAPRYRYGPVHPGAARSVDGLADAYARRRHTVIGLIFASPSDAIQSFADAFRLRRGD